MDFFKLIFIICALVYGGYHFVIAWFFSDRVIELYKRTKNKDSKYFPFIPKSFLNLINFNDNKKFTIWFFRIGVSLFLILFLFGLLVLMKSYQLEIRFYFADLQALSA